ncbi:MAG TPA: hypothetical protein VMV18_11400 [bacterium]|nr:hypothetical protein [bacterium]
MSARFEYAGPAEWLAPRSLVGLPVPVFHAQALGAVSDGGADGWVVTLGAEMLFDRNGLALLADALAKAPASVGRATFALVPDESARREYYSLQPGGGARVELPVTATRAGAGGETQLTVDLPVRAFPIPFPASMYGETTVSVPRALLLPARSPFDVLFANQIALLGEIERRAGASPLAFLRALARPRSAPTFPQRMGLAFRDVSREAFVHPTAVIEGSVIEAGARVGAHACVRWSVIRAGARLHDGAKVEQSVVGRNSWLMHDLVLYRSVAEEDVFLIHGPYQFSLFQRASAAFATILMDYRPDGKPIQVETPMGLAPYQGMFLGAVYGERSKTLGGSSTAPGRVIPPDVWLGQDPAAIHLLQQRELELRRVLPPAATRK